MSEQKGYHDEISFFAELIKQARKGYGIDGKIINCWFFVHDECLFIDLDNQLNFPLIQKTIINESIQISLRNNDFTTIIEFVLFFYLLLT